ncbi:TRMT61A [Cordylochernes scorpioides]|uniref:tRNA (adenine(58)-N(1))-methyltransferase n=1 Tax=Cordylochernes scorpioides TaxID=51811 RepID=A0ABY6KSI8_9ARAC|nr:TRMT61A [Cordylochernes scorpioides]
MDISAIKPTEDNKNKIMEGDTVIVYLSYNDFHQIRIQKDQVYQTKYGAIKHNDLIGTEYGNVFNCPKGWVYILKLTPEFWTESLTHRTQILYIPDISLVLVQLDIVPGSKVCEAGVGSGSMSYSILQAIGETGHLYTHDFHKERAELMQKEFSKLGLGDRATVQHRDVCETGFDLPETVDAVFLDLPEAWKALTFAAAILKEEGSRFCSFSPCIEQVQKTCETLTNLGFRDIETLECLQRKYEVKKVNYPSIEGTSANAQTVTSGFPRSLKDQLFWSLSYSLYYADEGHETRSELLHSTVPTVLSKNGNLQLHMTGTTQEGQAPIMSSQENNSL